MKNFNTELAKRLLAKSPNMATFVYAYNNTKGVETLGISTLYEKIKNNGLSTNFVRGSKTQKLHSTVVDKVLSGISINRRLDTSAKPAIRTFLGNICVCCGTSRGLEIDHIDGNRNNTQIHNLQLLCGTCHNEKNIK